VIEVAQMRDFVRDDEAASFARCQDQPPVQANSAL
jgi:hypothetical protein